jgi:hypothetical protein
MPTELITEASFFDIFMKVSEEGWKGVFLQTRNFNSQRTLSQISGAEFELKKEAWE